MCFALDLVIFVFVTTFWALLYDKISHRFGFRLYSQGAICSENIDINAKTIIDKIYQPS